MPWTFGVLAGAMLYYGDFGAAMVAVFFAVLFWMIET